MRGCRVRQCTLATCAQLRALPPLGTAPQHTFRLVPLDVAGHVLPRRPLAALLHRAAAARRALLLLPRLCRGGRLGALQQRRGLAVCTIKTPHDPTHIEIFLQMA